MPAKRYIVNLSEDERSYLRSLISKGKGRAYTLRRARILLKADQSDKGPGWTDDQISEALEVNRVSIERLRRRFVRDGLAISLTRKKQDHPSNQKFDGHTDAHLIALTCTDPPEGRRHWTLRLLADQMVALGHVDSISTETIRLRLKKQNLNPG